MCRIKLWKMMIDARKMCEGAPRPVGCIHRDRWMMCRIKLWKMMIDARKMCEGAPRPVGCIHRELDVAFGVCKSCLYRALYKLGPRVYGDDTTMELMKKF